MPNYFVAKPKKTNLKEAITFTIDYLDAQGNGVAYWQNKKVFIQGALVQETVKAKIIEQKSKFIKAKLVEVLTPSADRLPAKCQHYQQCGGCDLQHLTQSKQLEFKASKLQELFNREGITQILPWQESLSAKTWHYRRKARIGVQFTKQGKAIIGFRRRGSNQLQPIKQCVILVAPLASIFQPLQSIIDQLTQLKSIGHVEVIYSEINHEQQGVTLVIRQLKALNHLDRQHWLNAAKQYNWQIIIDEGKNSYALTAVNSLSYHLESTLNITFQFNDFIQVNDQINQQMIKQALAWLAPQQKDVVLDLFCGLGNFSLPIAQYVDQVIGIEGVQDMVKRATINAKYNNIDNATFFQADLNSSWLAQHWAQQCFTKAILDPARAGAYTAVEQLVTLKIATILYISCDATTLARDTKLLINAGYKIVKIALMDMFTHTKHSETMVLFKLR